MSLQGSFTGTTANERITPTIRWSAAQSVAGNYSDITATLTYRRTGDYITGGTWSGSLTVGETTLTGKKRMNIVSTADTVAISATVRVYHQDDGTLTVTISATGSISGSTLTSTTIAQSVTLDTIARASLISAADANIGSRTTVVVTRRSGSFTHTVAYQFGALTGYLDAAGEPVEQPVRLSDTVLNFRLPESFYAQIPDAPSGVCTLTCTTYAGDDVIGQSQRATFTATASPALCAPTVTGSVHDGNPVTAALTGDDTHLVRYASTAHCQITASARNGASIVSRRIGGVAVEGDTLDIAQPAFDALRFEATDSRGYTTAISVPVTLIPYVQLTNNATVQRTDPTSGNVLLTLQGSCWNGDFGATENPLSVEYAVEGETSWQDQLTITPEHTYLHTVSLSGLDYTRSYRLTVTVFDGVTSQTTTLTVQKGIPVFDWGENDFRFNVPVDLPALTVDGVHLADYIRAIMEGDQ